MSRVAHCLARGWPIYRTLQRVVSAWASLAPWGCGRGGMVKRGQARGLSRVLEAFPGAQVKWVGLKPYSTNSISISPSLSSSQTPLSPSQLKEHPMGGKPSWYAGVTRRHKGLQRKDHNHPQATMQNAFTH